MKTKTVEKILGWVKRIGVLLVILAILGVLGCWFYGNGRAARNIDKGISKLAVKVGDIFDVVLNIQQTESDNLPAIKKNTDSIAKDVNTIKIDADETASNTAAMKVSLDQLSKSASGIKKDTGGIKNDTGEIKNAVVKKGKHGKGAKAKSAKAAAKTKWAIAAITQPTAPSAASSALVEVTQKNSEATASSGKSCDQLFNDFNSHLGIGQEVELCQAADAILTVYNNKQTRGTLTCLAQSDIEAVKARMSACEASKIYIASWRKKTFSYKCQKKHIPGDLCNLVSKPAKTLKNGAPYIALCASSGDCRHLVGRSFGIKKLEPHHSGGLSGSSGGNSPQTPGELQGYGSGQDADGTGGTVAGTTGDQYWTNASHGLQQTSQLTWQMPAPSNVAIDHLAGSSPTRVSNAVEGQIQSNKGSAVISNQAGALGNGSGRLVGKK